MKSGEMYDLCMSINIRQAPCHKILSRNYPNYTVEKIKNEIISGRIKRIGGIGNSTILKLCKWVEDMETYQNSENEGEHNGNKKSL